MVVQVASCKQDAFFHDVISKYLLLEDITYDNAIDGVKKIIEGGLFD